MAETTVEFAKALADDTRQKIMKLCCCHWLTVNEIVEALGDVTQPTVSHHLAILRETGLVNVKPEGKHTYYSLDQARVAYCCGRLIRAFAPESNPAKAEKNGEISA